MLAPLSKALADKGYDSLTQVQEAVTAPELADQDLLVSAQTGSGKTVGFGLAIAPTLLEDADFFPPAGAPLALIIAPTRELALQVRRELSWLYAETGAQVSSTVGGMDFRDERRSLERGSHMVVATPGRLRDHIQRGTIDLSEIRAVVLDEADEMLDLGFREDLEFILSEAPETRRTLMFSATVPRSIASLAQSYQKDAVRVTTAGEKSQHADIDYRAMQVNDRDAENAIINVLRYYEAQNAIVFANTRAMVARLTSRFSNRGFPVVALSGELTQSERANALQAMRDGRARVCVATDVAARGIDLPNLDLVIHAELPSNHETLLHRSGRTGRAGRKGVSALIVPGKFRKKAERLLKFAKLNADWSPAPSAEAVREKDRERMLADPVWTSDAPEAAQPVIAQLVESFSAEQLASAYVQLYSARHSAPEDLGEAKAPTPRAPFGPSAWFSVSIGRNDGADPRRLLPMLCRAGDITRDDIGAIRIQYDQSYVEILESRKQHVMDALGPDLVLEDGVSLTALDKAPDLGPPPKRGPRPDRGQRPERGQRPDRGPWQDRGPKPDRDFTPGAEGEARKPRHSKSDGPRGDQPEWKKPSYEGKGGGKGGFDKNRDEKPRYGDKPRRDKPRYDDKPRGDKPRYEDKPRGDRFKGKPDGDRPRKGIWDDKRDGKPSDKPFKKREGKPGDKPFGKRDGKPGGKFGDKPHGKRDGKFGGKFGDKPRKPKATASDTSKRFTPPGGKSRGGDAPLRRGKPRS